MAIITVPVFMFHIFFAYQLQQNLHLTLYIFVCTEANIYLLQDLSDELRIGFLSVWNLWNPADLRESSLSGSWLHSICSGFWNQVPGDREVQNWTQMYLPLFTLKLVQWPTAKDSCNTRL